MTHTVKVGDKVRVHSNHRDMPDLAPSKVCTVVEAYNGFFEGREYCDVQLPCGKVRKYLHQSRFEVIESC